MLLCCCAAVLLCCCAAVLLLLVVAVGGCCWLLVVVVGCCRWLLLLVVVGSWLLLAVGCWLLDVVGCWMLDAGRWLLLLLLLLLLSLLFCLLWTLLISGTFCRPKSKLSQLWTLTVFHLRRIGVLEFCMQRVGFQASNRHAFDFLQCIECIWMCCLRSMSFADAVAPARLSLLPAWPLTCVGLCGRPCSGASPVLGFEGEWEDENKPNLSYHEPVMNLTYTKHMYIIVMCDLIKIMMLNVHTICMWIYAYI